MEGDALHIKKKLPTSFEFLFVLVLISTLVKRVNVLFRITTQVQLCLEGSNKSSE